MLSVRLAHRSPIRLDVELQCGPGELLALVGPSGAGKTTVLRCVAGLHRPDAGRVVLDGTTWFDGARGVDLAPERRSVGLVFQHYALFPHLTVAQNVGFGGAGAQRVGELLRRLRIDALADARPVTLSGGERQRTALARALARDPAVVLLDEPLAALDADTRATVRAELHDLLAGLALPTLLVTHDFADASALAQRIGVVVAGELRQLGTPHELLAHPADAFVVRFTGGAVLPGEAEPAPGGGSLIRLDANRGTVRTPDRVRGRVGLALHPWEPRLEAAGGEHREGISGVVAALEPAGDRVRVRVGDVVAERPASEVAALALRRGDPVRLLAPERPRTVPLAAGLPPR